MAKKEKTAAASTGTINRTKTGYAGTVKAQFSDRESREALAELLRTKCTVIKNSGEGKSSIESIYASRYGKNKKQAKNPFEAILVIVSDLGYISETKKGAIWKSDGIKKGDSDWNALVSGLNAPAVSFIKTALEVSDKYASTGGGKGGSKATENTLKNKYDKLKGLL